MNSPTSDFVGRAEAILSSAKQLKEKDGPVRLNLVKQVKHLYQDLEPPINSVGLLKLLHKRVHFRVHPLII